jgi:hypothetical protein
MDGTLTSIKIKRNAQATAHSTFFLIFFPAGNINTGDPNVLFTATK